MEDGKMGEKEGTPKPRPGKGGTSRGMHTGVMTQSAMIQIHMDALQVLINWSLLCMQSFHGRQPSMLKQEGKGR